MGTSSGTSPTTSTQQADPWAGTSYAGMTGFNPNVGGIIGTRDYNFTSKTPLVPNVPIQEILRLAPDRMRESEALLQTGNYNDSGVVKVGDYSAIPFGDGLFQVWQGQNTNGSPFDLYDVGGNYIGSNQFSYSQPDWFDALIPAIVGIGGGAVVGSAIAGAGAAGASPSIEGFQAYSPLAGESGLGTGTFALDASLPALPELGGAGVTGFGDAGLMYAGANAGAAGTLGGGASILGGASLMGSGAGSNLFTQFRDFFNSPAGKAAGSMLNGGGGMGTSSGNGSTTTVQRADPWAGIQPALLDMYSRALAQSQGAGPQYYGGSTLAAQSPETLQALQMLAQRARAGSPVTRGAQDTLQSTIRGDYLNSNPFLDEMFDSASNAVGRNFRSNVMPGIASMYSKAGRFGSNSMGEGLGQAEQQYGDTLKELADEIYGKNYSRERLYQQQALSLAPTLANQDYADLAQLAGVGTSRDQYAQAGIDADKARFDYNQMLPWDQLTRLNSILQPGLALSGSTSTSNVNTPRSPILGALGGSMLGSQVAPMIGSAFGTNQLGGFDLGMLGALGGGVLGGLFS